MQESKKKSTKFEDFNEILVDLAEVRSSIANFQKLGVDTMPLGEFLRVVKNHTKKVERPEIKNGDKD